MAIRIQPSILSADFVNFQSEFDSIGNADGIHVDVMDGHFVPNMTFGLPMVRRMQEISTIPLDVHLMLENPDFWAKEFASAGVFSVTVHYEACENPIDTAKSIHDCGVRAGISIKPATSVAVLEDIYQHFDQVLIMSVEPGFGGQSFIIESLEKIVQARELLGNSDVWLQVDGGVDESNIKTLAALGADTFVAGSAVFKHSDRRIAIDTLRRLAIEGENSN